MRVISIEPDTTNFRILRANQILNGKDEQFINVCAAAPDRDGVGLLELSPDNFSDHRVRLDSSVAVQDLYDYDEVKRNVIQTRLARIDTLLAENGVSAKELGLVWIDTQGHEGHALAGAQSLKSAKVPIVAEFWPYGLERSRGYKKLRDLLSEDACVYDLQQFIRSGSKTPLNIDDLDLLYDRMLTDETEKKAVFTDILIVFSD